MSEYVDANRAYWTAQAPRYAEAAERAWAKPDPDWGVWRIPEAEVRALPALAGRDVVELGCGTAYFSAWLARRGARPVGVDVTRAQLETARALQERHNLTFPLIEASAEDVPLPDASFDLVLSEYGASIWVDPYRWIPEAARLLRPGGELVFLVNGTLAMLCAPDDDDAPVGTKLERPYFGMHRFSWEGSVEFHLGYGDWIRLLRANGFAILDLIELRAPEGAREHDNVGIPPSEWARRWPSEEIWRARKEG
jgi:SAM-dependent methyltransferase